jgi:formylglycine-generating enzyme required for sulfatase activity
MARIFISYRREDSDIWVSRLVDELRRHFPPDEVFQDIASIDPGANFRDALEKALGSAAVMLAVIGRGWLSATDKQGRRRLDLAGDFVRLEVAESLRRPGVRVFPILVNGAEMPAEEELPDPLKELHLRQAFELTVRHWHQDVAQLVQTLKRVSPPSEEQGADQEATRQRAEEEAIRRDAEARAAQEEAERKAAEEQERKEAEEQARREAEEERRRVQEETRRTAAEKEARHKAEEEAARRVAVEAQEEAQRRAAEREAQRKRAEEEARRKAEDEERRRVEEEARQKAAEDEARRKAAEEEFGRRGAHAAEGKSAEASTVAGSKFGWKAVAGLGAIVGAVALLVVLGGREQRPSSEEPTRPAPKSASPVEAKPPATDTRRIVINGPKPLYAPFKTGDVFQECTECPEMVVIVPDPKGFTIGSPESEQGRQTDEKQLGPIRFAKPFAIGKHEVTRAQLRASGVQPGAGCYVWNGKDWQLDPQASFERPGFDQGADHPAVCVSWNEAQSYLGWLNRQPGVAGNAYRLPSEAEWEYAARAGTTTARYWGNEPNQACEYANVGDRSLKQAIPNWPWPIHDCSDGFVYTAPVGRFKSTAFGLYDMIGNVWEWVQDCYAEQYSESIRNGSAFETQNCGQRVVRGGSWSNRPEFARVAYRNRNEPANRNSIRGFRLARTF